MPILRPQPTDPGAQRLYAAIRDAINDLDLMTKLKLNKAISEGREWSELDPGLRGLFSAVAAALR